MNKIVKKNLTVRMEQILFILEEAVSLVRPWLMAQDDSWLSADAGFKY